VFGHPACREGRVAHGIGYSFSEIAQHLIEELIAASPASFREFNWHIASPTPPAHEQILIFLDRDYEILNHVRAVRDTLWQVGGMPTAEFTVTTRPRDHTRIGLLFVADVPTMYLLAERSIMFGQLLPIVDGQPDGETWVYFLGRAEGVAAVSEETVEAGV
jgi:hypothetical protein